MSEPQNVYELFSQSIQTLQEAEEKNKGEQGFSKIERYRISEDGEYTDRRLLLAPVINKDGVA